MLDILTLRVLKVISISRPNISKRKITTLRTFGAVLTPTTQSSKQILLFKGICSLFRHPLCPWSGEAFLAPKLRKSKSLPKVTWPVISHSLVVLVPIIPHCFRQLASEHAVWYFLNTQWLCLSCGTICHAELFLTEFRQAQHWTFYPKSISNNINIKNLSILPK